MNMKQAWLYYGLKPPTKVHFVEFLSGNSCAKVQNISCRCLDSIRSSSIF